MFRFASLAVVLVASSRAQDSSPYPCELPEGLNSLSLVTKDDAEVGVKFAYQGVSVGGELIDGSPDVKTVIARSTSFVRTVKTPNNFFFHGGVEEGEDVAIPIDFGHFEWLARNARDSDDGTFKVVVIATGGTFTTDDFRPGGSGEDNGSTLVLFNTDEDITLDVSASGQAFGPTVIAPFSHVEVVGDVKFVDGTVVAKSFKTIDGEESPASKLSLRADYFRGDIMCNQPRGGGGDPHFRTWKMDALSFHHQCDLVLVQTDNAEVQIRTTAHDFFSFISGVAVKIGEDVLEIEQVDHKLNGELNAPLSLGGRQAEMIPRPDAVTEFEREYHVPLSNTLYVVVRVRPQVMDVRFHGDDAELLSNSVGLMGNYNSGEWLSRNGKHVLEDADAFGKEWQVRGKDSQLFTSFQEPQWPERCIPPPAAGKESRMLRGKEGAISREEAEAACEFKSGDDRNDCIFDVLATGDLSMAQA